MKKFLPLVLIVAVAVLFSGCSMGASFLKTSKTSVSPSEFFARNYVLSVKAFEEPEAKAGYNLTIQTDILEYQGYVKSVYQALPEERCLIATLDFLMAKSGNADSSNRLESAATTKVFEYDCIVKEEIAYAEFDTSNIEDVNDLTAYIYLKSNKNDKEITTYLFYFDSVEVLQVFSGKPIEETLAQKADALEYDLKCKFEFTTNSYDKTTGTYSGITYSKSTTSSSASRAQICFNENKGSLTYEMITKLGSQDFTIKKQIYLYDGAKVGIRAITTQKQGAVTKNFVYEQYKQSFGGRLKVGEIKNLAEMYSMEAMMEDNLARAGVSDNKGFVLLYDTTNTSPIYSLTKYPVITD